MSASDLNRFLQTVSQDQSFQDEWAGAETLGELQAMADRLSLEVTEDELRELLASQAAGQELSDQELQKAAGGIQVKLDNVVISSYQTGGSSGDTGPAPSEAVVQRRR